MKAVGVIFGGLVGLISGIAAGLLLIPASAAFHSEASQGGLWITWSAVIAGTALGAFAPSMRRAFGRGFLLVGAAFLALPISVMLLSGRVAAEMTTSAPEGTGAAVAIGSGVAGLAMTGLAGFLGFIFGAIFVVIGLVLVLGGRREVYVVTR